MRSRYVRKRNIQLLEVTDAAVKHSTIIALANIGVYHVQANRVKNRYARYAETLGKILQKVKSPGCYAMHEPNGIPVVIVFSRRDSKPVTFMVETSSAGPDKTSPRVYILRCKFTDESIFDGTVIDATLSNDDSGVVSCKDVHVFRGSAVHKVPVCFRIQMMRDIFGSYVENEYIDTVKFKQGDWKLMDRMEIEGLVKADSGIGNGQIFVWTSDRELWRTPVCEKKREQEYISSV